MKIAVFYNLPSGGAKRALFAQLDYLSQKNKVFLFQPDELEKTKLPSFLKRLIRDLRIFVQLPVIHKKLAGKIDSLKADVALVHLDYLTQAPYVLRYLKTPSVYYCQEILRIVYEEELAFKKRVNFLKRLYEQATRYLRKVVDRKNARNADRIIVGTRYIKRAVMKAYGKSADVCPMGADSEVFKPLGEKKKKQVLFVGEKNKISGYHFAKKALNLIKNEVRPKLKVISFSSGKPKLTDAELAKEYSRSLLTLCTSYHEPFGLVAVESMASGTPVLAVNEGGYKETVVDGKTGYLLEREPKKFAEKIEYLAGNKEKALALGMKGREHVLKNFNWKKHGECLEKLLK